MLQQRKKKDTRHSDDSFEERREHAAKEHKHEEATPSSERRPGKVNIEKTRGVEGTRGEEHIHARTHMTKRRNTRVFDERKKKEKSMCARVCRSCSLRPTTAIYKEGVSLPKKVETGK